MGRTSFKARPSILVAFCDKQFSKNSNSFKDIAVLALVLSTIFFIFQNKKKITVKMQNEKMTKDYLYFIRKQRHTCISDLKLSFEEMYEKKVNQTTYTSEDVKSILDELQTIVQITVQNELSLHSHMNVLLLQQLLKQAVSTIHKV
jgi:hypothetical protein